MDDSYQVYVNRVAPLTLKQNQASQLANIRTSQKFNDGKPTDFPGCTIMTPPGSEDRHNQKFYQVLYDYQQELINSLSPGILVPLPPESFHCTVADLIWDENYQNAIDQNPEFDHKLAESVAASFEQYQKEHEDHKTVQFELIGLSFFPRSLVACLIPAHEDDYQRIVDLRRHIYYNENILALGIEKQRNNFTAHITLGYFGEEASNLHSENFLNTIAKINDRQADAEHPAFTVETIELRKFDNMVNFIPMEHGPIAKL